MRQLKPITPVPPISRDMDILANRPPSTRALDGETIRLEYDDGENMEMVISLYLLSTRDQPLIQLTLLLDLDGMKNAGRLYGMGPNGLVDRRCGAKITFLGEFTYPEGREPG